MAAECSFSPERISYTVGFKLKVIQYAREHGNRAAGHDFGTPETCARRWQKDEEKLRKLPNDKRALRGGKAKFPELEQNMQDWIKENNEEGISVSLNMMQEQAKCFATDFGIADFKASKNWCKRFLKRCKLMEDKQETTKSLNAVDVSFKRYLAVEKCPVSLVGNAGQTPSTFGTVEAQERNKKDC